MNVETVKNGLLKVSKIALVLFVLYGLIQFAVFVGVLYFLAGIYLLIGFMVAWEVNKADGHKLWFVVILFWLPFLLAGVIRKIYFRGESLTADIKQGVFEEIADEEVANK